MSDKHIHNFIEVGGNCTECGESSVATTMLDIKQKSDWQYSSVGMNGIILGNNVVLNNKDTPYIKIGFGDDILVDKPITMEQFNKFKQFIEDLTNNIKTQAIAEERKRIVETIEKENLSCGHSTCGVKEAVINLINKNNERSYIN